MRIGVNALYLIPGGVGGTEIYLRELLRALASIDSTNHYVVFTNRETGADLVPGQPNFEHAPQRVRASFRPARILWEQIVLPWQRVDVMLNPGFTAPIFASCPQVTVFHDLQHLRHPENFRWFDLPFWKLLLWASAHRSRKLIAVSAATRNDLVSFYGLAEDRISVIHHGVDRALFELPPSPVEPYILSVSTLHPHKNLERLVRAFAKIDPHYRLVIAGMRGFSAAKLEAAIAAQDLSDRVRLTGWIPREELYALYARARAFVYPSTFEGFGMPVLEALAAGLPLACSDIPPLREVAGDAAVYFDPADEDAIAASIVRLLNGPERDPAGPRRAAPFTWEAAARATLASLQAAVSRRS